MLCCADDPKEQLKEAMFNRSEEFKVRRATQIQTVDFPTTTIGSFPQTAGRSPPRHSFLPLARMLARCEPQSWKVGRRWLLCSSSCSNAHS